MVLVVRRNLFVCCLWPGHVCHIYGISDLEEQRDGAAFRGDKWGRGQL